MTEPVLTAEDRRIWDMWTRTALARARTLSHRRAVDSARRVVLEMAERWPDAYVAWSAGKDSTALTHLVRVECGVPGRAMSVKDDLDFPDEEDYLRRWAAAWNLELDVVRPPFLLQEWIRARSDTMTVDADAHSRSAALSREAFYGPVSEYASAAGLPGVYLGLRTEESAGRNANRSARGRIYTKAGGETVCQPIADWRGLDVYAYTLSRGIDLLPVYQCVRLMDRPDSVRKSWWLPGVHACTGSVVWLRAYYPSLYRRLYGLLPDARRHG